MCSKCAGGSFGCYCDGKGVFAACPASKGVYCPECRHYPGGLTEETYTGPYLEELLDPAFLSKAREAYAAAHPDAK